MPDCKKCEKTFPYRLRIDGKIKLLANRKYCLDCSPYKKHNTLKLEKIGKEGLCTGCGREFCYSKKQGHHKTFCNSCIQKDRRQKIKIRAVEYLGGKCVKCGYRKSVAALDFHHKLDDSKEFNISSNYNVSWDRIKKELDKCDLLCANCHREYHFTGV